MRYPEYVEANGKRYKINTDFRIAIRCNEIAEDGKIGEYERALAIIYILFGKEALKDVENHEKLLELAIKYLACGEDSYIDTSEKIEKDMDYSKDMDYIEASFMSDYHIDLANTKMHWWKFYHLICGLSNSELGNCCILNRIRNIRNYDISKIEDQKLRDEMIKAKNRFSLNRNVERSEEEMKSAEELFKELGFI